MRPRIAIAGAGIFGVTAAIELARRGFSVEVFDPGPLPHPLAESTDISKVVRLDYGADEDYTALMERALDGWRGWNAAWREPLFHETGALFVCRDEMAPGGFEYESHRLLTRRGHRLERLDGAALSRRFPAWNGARYRDGYFNPAGGYAESARVVAALLAEAAALGVRLHASARVARRHEIGSRVAGLVTDDGTIHEAEIVLIAAGAWTPDLVPALAPSLRAVGQPVFHLRPPDPAPYRADRFPVFGADIARTGYYGFCANRDGLVKIANHGIGRPMHPSSGERVVTSAEESALRSFLADTFPALAGAPIAHTRVCVYGDTPDEHFWIDRNPDRPNLVVAAGGSGHGFKFAPILGGMIANAVEGRPDVALHKFRWRNELRGASRGEEEARHRGGESV